MQRQVTGCEFTFFHVTMTTPIYGQNLHRSRDILIPQVSLPIQVLHCNQVCIPAVFEILGSKHIRVMTYLDLSRSRDVIGYVTIRFSISYWWNRASISKRFRSIRVIRLKVEVSNDS